MDITSEAISLAVLVMEVAGIVVILVGAAIASLRALTRRHHPELYSDYRRQLGRSIILGLEFLIAADIVRTVAVSQTFESVAVLGVVVLIRAFLALTLEAEIEGRWPWQQPPHGGG